jgi:hypothetical protein
VGWTQLDGSGLRQVYVEQYSGGTWSALSGSASGTGLSGLADAQLAGSITHSDQPTLAYFNGQLFAAWQTYSDRGTAVAVGSFSTGASPSFTVSDVFAAPELSSSPELTAGGNALRLLWVNTPLGNQPTDLYATRFNGSHFVEELPGEAQGDGLSVTGGAATQLVAATDASGRTTVVWQDNIGGQPEIYARGMTVTASRTFVSNGSTSLQTILDNNDLGAGDVIIVQGAVTGGATISANDAGVAIYGAPGSSIMGTITV